MFVSKTSWRRLQDVFKTSWRRLQRNNSSSKTSSRRFRKTPWRRLGRQKIVTLKTCWRPTNICCACMLFTENETSQHIFTNYKSNQSVILYISVYNYANRPPTHRPPTTYSATHRFNNYRPNRQDSFLSTRLDNRKISILQNTNTAGKIKSYTSVLITLKSDSYLSKKIVLFTSIKAL